MVTKKSKENISQLRVSQIKILSRGIFFVYCLLFRSDGNNKQIPLQSSHNQAINQLSAESSKLITKMSLWRLVLSFILVCRFGASRSDDPSFFVSTSQMNWDNAKKVRKLLACPQALLFTQQFVDHLQWLIERILHLTLIMLSYEITSIQVEPRLTATLTKLVLLDHQVLTIKRSAKIIALQNKLCF